MSVFASSSHCGFVRLSSIFCNSNPDGKFVGLFLYALIVSHFLLSSCNKKFAFSEKLLVSFIKASFSACPSFKDTTY